MKKNDKKFEKKLSQDLKQYYNDIEIPELSLEKQEELKNLVKQNKPKRKRFALWQRITAVASAVCLIALIIIPTVIMLNKNDDPQNPPVNPPTYYGDAEAIKIQHTLSETQSLVNTKFSKYNFIFNDLTYITSTGFYHPENNSLLAIKIICNESQIPYTQVEVHIIASKLFVFAEQTIYTNNAEFTTTNNYKMYKTNYQDPFTEYQRGYIIFEDHEIYINLARINDILFNKFI